MEYLTIQEASRPEYLNRSPNWIRCAIKFGKIKSTKKSRINFISLDEIAYLKKNMPTMSGDEMSGRVPVSTGSCTG